MSGRTLREFLRRHQPNGPHRVCYHCDSVVSGPRCHHCHSNEHIAPCHSACARCIEDARRKVRPSKVRNRTSPLKEKVVHAEPPRVM